MPIPWRIFKKRGELLAKKPSKKKQQYKQSTVITEVESEIDHALLLNASTNETKQVDNIEVCDSNDNGDDINISHNVISRHNCSNNDENVEEEDKEEGGTNDGILGSNNNKAICLLVLKGSLIFGVAILTQRFILGIILGSFLLLLFGYVGDSIIQFCEPFVRRIQGFVYTYCNDSNECQDHVEANNGLRDVKECDSEHGVGNNDLVFSLSRRVIIDQDDENVVCMNGEIEHDNVKKLVINDSKRIDEEMWDKIVTTIQSLDPNSAQQQQRNSCYAPGGLCELQGITLPIPGSEEEEFITLKMANRNYKAKKGKKFWKKFAIKHRRNKPKNNNNNRDDEQLHESDCCEMNNNDCNEKFELELGEDDDEYDGDEPGNFDTLFEDDSRIRNHKFTYDNCVQISDDMLRLQGINPKLLVMVLAALGGLVQGRIFAIVITFISCFVLKIMKM